MEDKVILIGVVFLFIILLGAFGGNIVKYIYKDKKRRKRKNHLRLVK